jgi:lipoprotein-anchoring transpeptidase ErfK/SrfK
VRTIVRTRPSREARAAWTAGPETLFSHAPQRLLVLGSRTVGERQWLRVLLPIRPNGSSGWIPRELVTTSRTRWWVTVAKGARTVTVLRDGRRVRRFAAVIGKAATPTPVGLAAIYERNLQQDPNAFLGPWALPLTLHSNVLRSYGGGPGRVAIHGRSGASLGDPVGTARSHGCVRISNGPVTWMATRLPAGTPVQVRR